MKKMKESVWLRQKLPRGFWTHGLARLENGMIVVAECHGGGLFVPVGQQHISDTEREPERLFPNEKKLIVRSLFRACWESMEKNDQEYLFDLLLQGMLEGDDT